MNASVHQRLFKPYKHLRALVVDDNATNAQVLSMLLNKFGVKSVIVSNGFDGLSAVAKGQFDLVFMDYQMPILNGLDATTLIRQLPEPCNQTPVIMVTADVCPDTYDEAFARGVNAFINKPVRLSELHNAIDHALGNCVNTSGQSETLGPQRHSNVTVAKSLLNSAYKARRPMIDNEIFRELHDLIPAKHWHIMLDSLFASSTGDIDVLITCLNQGDRTAIGEQAHRIKGAALLMGLRALGEISEQLEQRARHSNEAIDPETWASRFQKVARESQMAIAALSQGTD